MSAIRSTDLVSFRINQSGGQRQTQDQISGRAMAGNGTIDQDLRASAGPMNSPANGSMLVTDAWRAFQALLTAVGGPGFTGGASPDAATIAIGDLLSVPLSSEAQARLMVGSGVASAAQSGATERLAATARPSRAADNSGGIGVAIQALEEDPEEPADRAAEMELYRLMYQYDPESSDADDTAVAIANNPALLRELTRAQKLLLVRGLFDGNTTREEEQAALRILRSHNDRDLAGLIRELGRDELESELGEDVYKQLEQKALTPRARINELMRDYDPTSSGADDVARRIVADPAESAALSREQKLLLIRGLFDGPTGADDEKAARALLASHHGRDTAWLVGKLGMSVIEDELGSAERDSLIAALGAPQQAPDSELSKIFSMYGFPSESIRLPEGISPNVRGAIDKAVYQRMTELPREQLDRLVKAVLSIKASIKSEALDPGTFSRLLSPLAEIAATRGLDPDLALHDLANSMEIATAEKASREGLEPTPLLTLAMEHMYRLGQGGTDLRSDEQEAALIRDALSRAESVLVYDSMRGDPEHRKAKKPILDELAQRIREFREGLQGGEAWDRRHQDEMTALVARSTEIFGNPDLGLQIPLGSGWGRELLEQLDLQTEEGRMLADQMSFSDRITVLEDLITGFGRSSSEPHRDGTWLLDLLARWKESQPAEMYRVVHEVGYERLHDHLGHALVQLLDGRYTPSWEIPRFTGTIRGGF